MLSSLWTNVSSEEELKGYSFSPPSIKFKIRMFLPSSSFHTHSRCMNQQCTSLRKCCKLALGCKSSNPMLLYTGPSVSSPRQWIFSFFLSLHCLVQRCSIFITNVLKSECTVIPVHPSCDGRVFSWKVIKSTVSKCPS
jgi:hypothetical protein